MAGGSAPRYAPSDPSLPPQWKALVDGNTGYIYYWNTETNITQYEKPLPPSGGNTIPPGPPPAPPISARPPKLATLPTTTTATSPFRSGDNKRGSSSGKNGTTTSTATPPSLSNNPSEEGMIVSPAQHVSVSGRRSYLDNDRRNYESERRYQEPDRTRYSTGTGISDLERRHPGSSFSEPERRYPSGANQPDHHRADISDHHRTGHPHVSETRGRPTEAYGRSLSDHHGRHMQDHPRAPSGGNVTRPRHVMSESVPRPSPHNIPGGSMHANSTHSSFGGSGSSRHAHDSPVVSGRSTSSSKNDRDGRANVGSLTKLPSIPPALQGQQDDMRSVHYDHDRPMGSSHLDVPLPGVPAASLKRSANDYPTGVADVRKRPRTQDPSIATDVQTYRMHHEITVVGDNVPPPFITFDSGKFPSEIHRELYAAGFTAPTPIQAQSWPIALQNRDLVAIAKTGSGKTLGYLLPAFLHLLQTRGNSRGGPTVLVLAPTRELATQIQDEALKFGRSSRISTVCVYGGAPKGPQLKDLECGADIVIATPGRLNDFLDVKKISLKQVTYLVLDEADRMLDMGFEPQIRKIVKEVPSSRQTLMFTATWPREVRKIAADLLFQPVQVNIGNSDELTANKAITQCVEIVQPYEKLRRLEQILQSQEPGSKVIIFCATKKMCDQLARKLQAFRAASIHGDKSQTERDYVLAQFRSGRSPILVATDVAARGLDVKDIRVVINYDFPTGVEDYVHRIGRTGRAGATGVAFTFFSEQDSKHARELVKILEGAEQKVPLELRHFSGRLGQLRGRGPWQAEVLDDKGPGHRPIRAGSRDIGIRGVGPWDEGLLVDGSGHLNYPDGIRDRDMGRVGSMGDRVGDLMGREGRISSRAEVAGSRGPFGIRGGTMSMRDRDIQGVVGTRDGISGTRERRFKSSQGGHKDGWDEHPNVDGWGAEPVGSVGDAGFKSSKGGHKDGWGKGRLGDDGWDSAVDRGTRVGGFPSHRESGFIRSETGRKVERGGHPHPDGWGVDKRGGTSEGAHKDAWSERSHDDGWGIDSRVGAEGFKTAEAVHKDRHIEHADDDGWGLSIGGGRREEGFRSSESMHKGRPGVRPHDDGWGINRIPGTRDGGFKRGGWDDGWVASSRVGGISDAKEGAFKGGGQKDGRAEQRDRWGSSTRAWGISDARGGTFKSLEGGHKDGQGEHLHHEGWGGSVRVTEVSGEREVDFRSLQRGHKDGRNERPHDGWGISPRASGSKEGVFKSTEGENKDGQHEYPHNGWGVSPRAGGSRKGGFKSSEGENKDDDDGWGACTDDGDGWGIESSDSFGRSNVKTSNLQGNERHGRRDDIKYGYTSRGGRMSGDPSSKQSERGRIFDRLGDRKDHLDKYGYRERSTYDRLHPGVAKDGSLMGSRSSSRGRSPDKGWAVKPNRGRSRSPSKAWEKGHSGSRSRSPRNMTRQTDDMGKSSLSGLKRHRASSPPPSRSLNASRETSRNLADQVNQHEGDQDGRHPNESQKVSPENKDGKEQPIENHAMDPELDAEKVTSSVQHLNTEQDAIIENDNQHLVSGNTAKLNDGIITKSELPDSNVDVNVSAVEQNIAVKDSTGENHVVTHDSLASEQITDNMAVDDTLISENPLIKSNNISGIDTIVSSPEEGLIEG